jgi:peptidoglycan hydrolase-like protein with peptidoglycan-binding domain
MTTPKKPAAKTASKPAAATSPPKPKKKGSPRAGLPILSVGSSDPVVPGLFAKLAELGYDTPTSRGENPHAVVGAEELQAARQFRRDHDVTDDADAFEHGEADQHIGPWTIEAILAA